MAGRRLLRVAAVVAGFGLCGWAQAAVITLSSGQFTTTPVFSDVQNFEFSIDIEGVLAPGVYVNPSLNGVQYSVNGSLVSGTPSGFPAFNLERTISGADFYAQGSSLAFEIIGSANLGDGLQVSELAGSDPVFVFNGREVDTGRYHPALFQLNADGTGSIRNSNNSGGINPSTMQLVNVELGEEYITEFTFDSDALTIAVVPLPAPLLLFCSALGAIAVLRKRSQV